MKITKKDLKQMIIEILNEQPVAPDIARLQRIPGWPQVQEHITKTINTPQEFLALVNLIVSAVEEVKPEVKSGALRKALAGAAEAPEAPPEAGTAPEASAPGVPPELSERRRTKKVLKRRK